VAIFFGQKPAVVPCKGAFGCQSGRRVFRRGSRAGLVGPRPLRNPVYLLDQPLREEARWNLLPEMEHKTRSLVRTVRAPCDTLCLANHRTHESVPHRNLIACLFFVYARSSNLGKSTKILKILGFSLRSRFPPFFSIEGQDQRDGWLSCIETGVFFKPTGDHGKRPVEELRDWLPTEYRQYRAVSQRRASLRFVRSCGKHLPNGFCFFNEQSDTAHCKYYKRPFPSKIHATQTNGLVNVHRCGAVFSKRHKNGPMRRAPSPSPGRDLEQVAAFSPDVKGEMFKAIETHAKAAEAEATAPPAGGCAIRLLPTPPPPERPGFEAAAAKPKGRSQTSVVAPPIRYGTVDQRFDGFPTNRLVANPLHGWVPFQGAVGPIKALPAAEQAGMLALLKENVEKSKAFTQGPGKESPNPLPAIGQLITKTTIERPGEWGGGEGLFCMSTPTAFITVSAAAQLRPVTSFPPDT